MEMEGPPTIELEERITAGGRRRIFTSLPAAWAARYGAAVLAAAPRIERILGDGVAAGRLPGGGPRPVALERRAWHLRHEGAGRRGFVVVGDVEDCYPSIHGPVVARALRRAGVDPAPIDRVLAACADRGTSGLPVGPWPSTVLANLVLAEADRAARRCGAVVYRWVDDVELVVDDRAQAVRALDGWVGALASLGLRAHEGKTAIVSIEDVWDRVRRPGDVACYARGEDPLPSHAHPYAGSSSSR
jgi:hypothetical protein